MSSLLNIINNLPAKSRGQQSKLEAFFDTKKPESWSEKQEQEQEAGGGKLMALLSKGGGGSSWEKNVSVVSNADILLTNRLKIQEGKTGWRMGSDGVRTYSTYRGGQLVTGSGAEAMRLSMGDNKSKSKSKGQDGAVDKGKENKGASKIEKKAQSKNKRKDGAGSTGPAKADANLGSRKKPRPSVAFQSRTEETSAPAPLPCKEIQPQAYQGVTSSIDTGAVDDWGF